MRTSVSLQDKKSFIRWFLNHYQLKKRESVWILNYLLHHEKILSNVHFVRDVRYCSRGIVMTSNCSEESPFRFNKQHIVTTDPDKTFHDIRLNQTEPLYIQLNFKNAHQNPTYVGILEDNPYIPDDLSITKEDRHYAQQILSQLLFDFKYQQLGQAIDEALDKREHQRFLTLTKQLNELIEDNMVQPYSKIE